MSDNATAIDWRALLTQEIKAAGKKGKSRVAARLGVSRSYVSRVTNPDGKSAYAEVPQSFIDRVINRFHVVRCPPRGDAEVPHRECAKANDSAPTHNPLQMYIWRECQRCPNKPEKE